jgi:F-type H+-transporting ATPase subunit epsilon
VSIQLEILVPDGAVVQTRISRLSGADATGHFGLLPHHQNFLTLLAPCVLGFQVEDGGERYAAADGGVLLLAGDRLAIVTREAVVADELDKVADAVEAMLEARRQREETARTEFAGLRARLLRELSSVDGRR